MRVRLQAGKQRELISLAKGATSWPKLSVEVGVAQSYLRNDLRNEHRFLSEDLFLKLCKRANVDFSFFVLEYLDDNWGRSLGGKSSTGNTKEITQPLDSEALAEFIGIFLGDGNLTVIKDYKVGTYELTISGDSRLDVEYYKNYLKPLVLTLFGLEAKMYFSKEKNAVDLVVHSKKLTDFLMAKEIPPGDKILNQVVIPSWVHKNSRMLSACLRGLYDTDGGAYKLNNQNTYQIVLTNHNEALLNNVYRTLITLGIRPSKPTKRHKLYITRKSELRKFLKLIGFKNPRHLSKVNKWPLYSPVV